MGIGTVSWSVKYSVWMAVSSLFRSGLKETPTCTLQWLMRPISQLASLPLFFYYSVQSSCFIAKFWIQGMYPWMDGCVEVLPASWSTAHPSVEAVSPGCSSALSLTVTLHSLTSALQSIICDMWRIFLYWSLVLFLQRTWMRWRSLYWAVKASGNQVGDLWSCCAS